MGHVSWHHRDYLVWFFDRTNLEPGIKRNTNQQIAGILTKGSFSRERWSQLTHLFNLTTPHVRTDGRLSDLFSSVQKRGHDVKTEC